MAEFLITKGNDERLIDEKRWEFYQKQGYRKSADVLKEMNAGKEPAEKTKAELLKDAKELGIDVPSKATVAQIKELIAAKEAENSEPDAGNGGDNNTQQ